MVIKRAYLKKQVVGNMRILDYLDPTICNKGLMPRYSCECLNCGRVKTLTQDALRKRDNTNAIKCYSCAQEKAKAMRRTSVDHTTHDGFNAELHNKFISMRL